MIRNVVVAIDGSAPSVSAANFAMSWVKKTGGEITCLMVVDERKFQLPLMYASSGYEFPTDRGVVGDQHELLEQFSRMRDDAHKFAQAVTDAWLSHAHAEGIPARKVVRDGYPPDIIREEALAGDLLVIGRRGEHASYKKQTAGTLTEELIQHCSRPVAVVPEGNFTTGPCVVLYDCSDAAERAIQFVARGLPDGKNPVICLVHDDESALECSSREEIFLESHDIHPRFVKSKGHKLEAIMDVGKTEGAACFVAGARSKTTLGDLLSGGRNTQLIRESEIPVIVVF